MWMLSNDQDIIIENNVDKDVIAEEDDRISGKRIGRIDRQGVLMEIDVWGRWEMPGGWAKTPVTIAYTREVKNSRTEVIIGWFSHI